MKNQNKILFWIIFFTIVIFDQALKQFAEFVISKNSIILNNWISFSLSHNTGCAWGFLQNNNNILAIIGATFIIIIFLFRNYIKVYEFPITFGMLSGGIVGNILDRIFRGYVVDFIDINLQIYRWPTFNIADFAMCVAVFLLLFQKNNS